MATGPFLLDKQPWFPDPRLASGEGLLAVGGDLSLARLKLAYRHGIFPWYSDGDPILWWSPDPRFVLRPEAFKLRRSLRKVMRQNRFELRYDTCFERVIRHCSRQPRPGQQGTWITDAMIDAFVRLHQAGFAHSVEVFLDDTLVGGLYGIAWGVYPRPSGVVLLDF